MAERQQADVSMAGMGGIERSAQNADAPRTSVAEDRGELQQPLFRPFRSGAGVRLGQGLT